MRLKDRIECVMFNLETHYCDEVSGILGTNDFYCIGLDTNGAMFQAGVTRKTIPWEDLPLDVDCH